MSVSVLAPAGAPQALLGASSIDLADQTGSPDLIGPFDRDWFALGCIVLASIPWVYVGAFAALWMGR